MESFYSLRDFLLLTFMGRSVHQIGYSEHFVKRYDKAKELWEKYGDNPPSGKIRMLQRGFGGGEGCIRTLVGTYEKDPREFLLTDDNGHNYISLRDFWWLDFEPIEKGEEDKPWWKNR